MKLKDFIKELQEISIKVKDFESIEVRMADCVSVVKPILIDNTVYITDIE